MTEALLYLAVYAVSQIVTVNGAAFYGRLIGLSDTGISEFVNSHISELTLISGALTLVAFFLGFIMRKNNPLYEVGVFKMKAGNYPASFLMGIFLNFFVVFLISVLPLPLEWLQSYEAAITDNGIGELAPTMIITTTVVSPIVEEVLFRGLIYTRLRRAMPMLGAMILSAFVFGIMHGTTVLWVSYAMILGFVLTWVYEKCGSLIAPILLHMGFNLVGSLSAILPAEFMTRWIFPITIASGVLSFGMALIISHNSDRKISLYEVVTSFRED